jgi:hypothetical protein
MNKTKLLGIIALLALLAAVSEAGVMRPEPQESVCNFDVKPPPRHWFVVCRAILFPLWP